MGRTAGKLTIAMVLVVGSIVMGALFSYRGAPAGDDSAPADSVERQQGSTTTATVFLTTTPTALQTPQPTATETIPPYTPLPTLTPSQTLKPPPTLEPPTATPSHTPPPTITPTPVTELDVSIPGLNGAESPTPTSTPGCEPREDWHLTYTVQFDDALSTIATRYGTWTNELAEANCITDPNLITVGQVLRVPGETQPYQPEVECVPWEPLTPFNGSATVPSNGSVTFNWRGPMAPKNLIRIYRPDGTVYERLVELRQNETINLNAFLLLEGQYTWYVYPLGNDYQQIECLEGGPWTFWKGVSATPTPTTDPNAATGGGVGP